MGNVMRLFTVLLWAGKDEFLHAEARRLREEEFEELFFTTGEGNTLN